MLTILTEKDKKRQPNNDSTLYPRALVFFAISASILAYDYSADSKICPSERRDGNV